MNNDLLKNLLDELERPILRYNALDSIYYGTNQNGLLSQEIRKAMDDRIVRLSVGIPKLAVTSLAERLNVRGFKGVDIWPEWLRNDLDQLQDVVHRESLCLGESYVIVWADSKGRPKVSVESAYTMAVIRDPGTREVTAAIKRWNGPDSTEATVFTPQAVYRLRAQEKNAKTNTSFTVYETLDNPLGVVPVVVFTNSDRFAEHGVSEIDALADLCEGLNLALANLALAQADNAHRRQWATGVALEERVVVTIDDDGNAIPVLGDDGEPLMAATNPIEPGIRSIVVEPADAKVGQLEGSNLGGFEAAVRIWISAIQAVSALPASALGILSNQPTSADAERAASAAIAARAEGRAATFGRSWERVAKLIYCVLNPGANIDDVEANVVWQDFSTRSESQLADATVKLVQADILPVSWALQKLGYSHDEILEIRQARRTEALDNQGITLPRATAPNASTGQSEAIAA